MRAEPDAGERRAAEPDRSAPYRAALLDWMACAVRGRSEPAARAAAAAGDGLLERVAALGTAGHVLDFDDTYLPGIAHLSAPVAPAAIAVGAAAGATVGDVLDAYARGFEAMGALARAGHPALYDRGWHPTAVCGGVGAAIAAAALLDAPAETAAALAALRASGLRAAFGSDGKSLQVGLAAASGVAAAQLAAAGATVPLDRVAAAWRDAYGGEWAEPGDGPRAIERNWIKAWPCCLQTHGAIECAERVGRTCPTAPSSCSPTRCRARRRATTTSRRRSRPSSRSPTRPPTRCCTAARASTPSTRSTTPRGDWRRRIEVRTDPALGESEFALLAGDEELARVDAARGSPEHPLAAEELRAKVHDLAGGGSMACSTMRLRRAERSAGATSTALGREVVGGRGRFRTREGACLRLEATQGPPSGRTVTVPSPALQTHSHPAAVDVRRTPRTPTDPPPPSPAAAPPATPPPPADGTRPGSPRGTAAQCAARGRAPPPARRAPPPPRHAPAYARARLVQMPRPEQPADLHRRAELAPVLVGDPVLGELQGELGLRHARAGATAGAGGRRARADAGRLELGDERVRPQLLVADGPERHGRGRRRRSASVRPTST